MNNCFLFEGIGIGSLEEFFYHFIKDFDFRELSLYISKKCNYNLCNIIDKKDQSDPILKDQIITTLCNIISFQKIKAKILLPDLLAGHSLGVYSAMFASGAIELNDTVTLLSNIHNLLQNSFKDEDYLSVIIIAPSIQDLRQTIISKSRAESPIYLSNINTPKQGVACGPKDDIISLFEYYHDLEKIKDKTLKITYPVHTPYIKKYKDKLLDIVNKISIRDPKIPVINTINQNLINNKEDLKDYIIKNLYNPVHWFNTIEAYKTNTVFYDIGLRYYIAQLMFWIDKKIKCFTMKKIFERNSFING